MNRLPQALLNSLQNIKGFNENSFVAVHENREQLTSVRTNPFKQNNHQSIINNLTKVPWCSNGFYLPERPLFTTDPLFHAGTYYVQEASSMFLEEALKQTVDLLQPLKVLDLCAAPGGKSTLIQSLLNEESFLVSNEVIKTRVTILAENIAKWGAANVVVTNNDPKDFQRLQNYFDVIVVDAPCSGSGLFRKDAAAINEWSENNVLLCSQRQQRILADVLPALKEDGILIYSTCSYSQQEDEVILDWLMTTCNMETVKLQLQEDWGIVETHSQQQQGFGYRFYPDKVKGEGFFLTVLKKHQHNYNAVTIKNTKANAEKITATEAAVIKPYLKQPDNFFFIKQQTTILALPLCLQPELEIFQSSLYIKKAGVKLGTVIRNELIPEHELAVSSILNSKLPSVTADEITALQYLRRQDVNIETARKGWALICYKNLPLGWMKILPNRINNYYPTGWRIVNK